MATSHFESLESPFLCSTCCCFPALVGACSRAELSIICAVRRSRVGVGCACGLPALPFLLPLPTAGTGCQPSAGSCALQCFHARITLPGWTCLGVPVADRACCLRCCLSLLPAVCLVLPYPEHHLFICVPKSIPESHTASFQLITGLKQQVGSVDGNHVLCAAWLRTERCRCCPRLMVTPLTGCSRCAGQARWEASAPLCFR